MVALWVTKEPLVSLPRAMQALNDDVVRRVTHGQDHGAGSVADVEGLLRPADLARRVTTVEGEQRVFGLDQLGEVHRLPRVASAAAAEHASLGQNLLRQHAPNIERPTLDDATHDLTNVLILFWFQAGLSQPSTVTVRG